MRTFFVVLVWKQGPPGRNVKEADFGLTLETSSIKIYPVPQGKHPLLNFKISLPATSNPKRYLNRAHPQQSPKGLINPMQANMGVFCRKNNANSTSSIGTCACMLSCFHRFWDCNHMDCSLPGPSVHGILQARILELVAMAFSRGIFLTQGLKPHLSPALVDGLFTTAPHRDL